MLDNVNQIVVGGTVDPNNKIDIKIAKDISGQV